MYWDREWDGDFERGGRTGGVGAAAAGGGDINDDEVRDDRDGDDGDDGDDGVNDEDDNDDNDDNDDSDDNDDEDNVIFLPCLMFIMLLQRDGGGDGGGDGDGSDNTFKHDEKGSDASDSSGGKRYRSLRTFIEEATRPALCKKQRKTEKHQLTKLGY
jgi:hypothetical protein